MININVQEPIKQDLSLDGVDKPLRIKEIFNSIQGEGPFAGVPATFIRFGGCNIKCVWCDTDYTKGLFDADVYELIEQVPNELVVLTGGEPFAQNITPLVNALLNMGKSVQIETNGTLDMPALPWSEIAVVVSPKTGKLHPAIMHNAVVFKYVVGVEDKDSPDGLPTVSTQGLKTSPAKPPNKNVSVYLMPRDDKDPVKNEVNNMVAAHLCMKFGRVLTMQLHKIVGLR